MSCDFFTNPGVAGLQPYQAGKPISELQRELGLEHIVKLASNENPLGTSTKVKQAIERELIDVVRYPDSNGFELKAALSSYLSVQSNQITLGNGSNDVLDLIARSFLAPGKSAIYSQHAFIVYPIAVQASGARAIVTPAKNWGHDLDAMAAAIEEDTSLIFIANPNNPTGTCIGYSAFIAFMEKVPSHVLVILDEAYFEYHQSDMMPNGIDLLKQYPNLIVSRTFSKAWGLAALRVGYAVASEAITDRLNRIRQPFNVNSLAQAAAVAILDDKDYLERGIAVNRNGMEQLSAAFNKLELSFIPSAGNFISFESPVDTAMLYQELLKLGVIVRPVGVYEMPKYLRVSIGLEEENQSFIDKLPLAIENVGKS